MKKSLIRTLVALSILWTSHAAYADTFTFATLPASGNLAGPASSTVGWGYKLTNQSVTQWLVTTNILAGLFQHGSANALFDFPIIAPGNSVTLAYNSIAGQGLYELAWDSTPTVGFTNSGSFIVSAEWWSGDPFSGGNFISGASDQSAGYSATVTATPAPEPNSFLLLGFGCAMIALKKMGRQKNFV